jgi:antitoxin VbhA-like protein
MAVKEPFMTLTERELAQNLRAVDHAVAQQKLEGLTVSESTVEDMRRAARGEIPADEVIANIYARFGHVAILGR